MFSVLPALLVPSAFEVFPSLFEVSPLELFPALLVVSLFEAFPALFVVSLFEVFPALFVVSLFEVFPELLAASLPVWFVVAPSLFKVASTPAFSTILLTLFPALALCPASPIECPLLTLPSCVPET